MRMTGNGKTTGGGDRFLLAVMVALAMVLALSVAGTASGEDMPAGTSAAETAVKSAGKTGGITFPAGSYIVDMGDTFSDNAQLKPYGLIYDLVLNAKVPVYWVINGSKTSQTGVDLTYNGKGYISGPFVISGDDVDYNVRSMLSTSTTKTRLRRTWTLPATTSTSCRTPNRPPRHMAPSPPSTRAAATSGPDATPFPISKATTAKKA